MQKAKASTALLSRRPVAKHALCTQAAAEVDELVVADCQVRCALLRGLQCTVVLRLRG